jgi:chemotaxis signal transduction protein
MTRLAGIPQQGRTSDRAALMRAEFDAGFSRVPTVSEVDLTDVLTLRIGEAPCLVRLSDVAELIAQPVLTAVPSPVPALLGITTGRGSPVAAYDLGLLLDQVPAVPQWLLLLAAEPEVGIAFEHFDGYHRLPLTAAKSYRLVEIPALLDTIRKFRRPARDSDLEIES